MSTHPQFRLTLKEGYRLFVETDPYYFRHELEELKVPLSSLIDRYPNNVRSWATKAIQSFAKFRSGNPEWEHEMDESEHLHWQHLLDRCVAEPGLPQDATEIQIIGREAMKQFIESELKRILNW